MIAFLQRITAGFLTFFMMLFGVCIDANNWDTVSGYKKTVESIAYENTVDTALPQTEIYRLIDAHFKAPLPAGKTEKKVLVLGYDGCRADTLSRMTDARSSAIRTLTDNGGSLLLSYCGGVNYPAFNTQATSTAPGWCSMLTGQWADVHGITDNGIEKSNDHLTLLTTLVENGTIGSSAFYVSWGGHFSGEGTTYWQEKQYIEEKKLAVDFSRADDDNGTFRNVLDDVQTADCSDFIFSIFEYCDHAGHNTGFNLKNPDYTKAFADAETQCKTILNAVEARETYDTEDWLILITSDHGGYNFAHGTFTVQERMTFIASNKPISA